LAETRNHRRRRRFGNAAGGCRRRIEIDGADQVGVAPGQLTLAGLFIDLGADLGHGLLDLHAGRSEVKLPDVQHSRR
jgi:hypothetical protein